MTTDPDIQETQNDWASHSRDMQEDYDVDMEEYEETDDDDDDNCCPACGFPSCSGYCL